MSSSDNESPRHSIFMPAVGSAEQLRKSSGGQDDLSEEELFKDRRLDERLKLYEAFFCINTDPGVLDRLHERDKVYLAK